MSAVTSAVKLISTSLLVAVAGMLAMPASAHRPVATPDNATLKQILAGDEVKRTRNSGRGMPSIMGPFPDTLNMEWLGQIPNRELGASRLIWSGATFLSDIWGWTSAAGKEYAIIGHNSGVAFVRITDPANPQFLGTVPTINTETQRNFWWDIKTYGNYAYFVSEVPGTGVGIVNMSDIDSWPVQSSSALIDTSKYLRYKLGDGSLVAAHNISINEESGHAYLTGVTKDLSKDPGFTTDGMVILDLDADPLAPSEVGQLLHRGTHDTQVVSYSGPDSGYVGKEIAFVFNGEDKHLGIYDVSNKADIKTISETEYAGASYTHQGWVTEDRKFLVMGDEEDELFGLQDPRNPDLPKTARTYVWNIENLQEPEVVSTFDSPAASIDHNVFIKKTGDREFVYQANYTAGIRVTELIRDVDGKNAHLEEVAHMDTEPRLPNNHLNYNFNIWAGPWGVYPFFDSGTIIASDGLNGLVLMKLKLTP